ncbi:MAG: hypothetical protein C4542_06720 [Dehalococcoidia bacterium]|nr:MAG: hypothetical protein C4542_06720 [Dehalococcoidia bacterium]
MDSEVQNIYTDGVSIGVSPFTVQLAFTMAPPGQGGTMAPVPVVNVRMSLEHAKVLAMLLKRQLKAFEDAMGTPIQLHPQIYTQLGISRQEEW